MTDQIYIRNKQRARSATNNYMRTSDKYQPEYVKHDLKPIVKTSVDLSDSLYAEKEEKPFITSKKPRRKYVVENASTARPTSPHVSVGQNHDHTWYPNEPEAHNEPILYEEVEAPSEAFVQTESFDSSSVSPGEYCIVINGDVVWSSLILDEIEEAIQIILYEKKAATLAELAVFKRLPVKIGVSVKDD